MTSRANVLRMPLNSYRRKPLIRLQKMCEYDSELPGPLATESAKILALMLAGPYASQILCNAG
jgi:hypothetical protein